MTLREFLARHTSSELCEIKARDRIDPYDRIGRVELAIAKLCALLWNVNRGGNDDVAGADDYLPKWGASIRDEVSAEAMTPEMLSLKLRAAFGIK